jgi:hypothetical protein
MGSEFIFTAFFIFLRIPLIFAPRIGEMAEWSNAAVLKTVEGHTSGGSNPSLSAIPKALTRMCEGFLFAAPLSYGLRRRSK